MYLISAYFDEENNRRIQAIINDIAKKTGNSFMVDNHVPPHITIASIEAKSTESIKGYFDSLNGKFECGNIFFATTGQLFPYVMYIAPVLNEYLQNISQTVADTFKGINELTLSRYYKPYSWLPHVTVGKTLNKEQMRIAFEVMQNEFVPFEACITQIGLAETNPHKDIDRLDL